MFGRLRRRSAKAGAELNAASLVNFATQSPNLILVAIDGRIVRGNPAAEHFLCAGGRSALRGRPILELFHVDDRGRASELLAFIRDTGRVPEWTGVRLVDEDGHPLEFEVTGAPVELDGRRAVVIVGRDESGARRASEALVESERRYETLAAAAPVAIYRLDAEGRCVYLNRRWSELTGIPIEEALGRSWLDLVADPGRPMAHKVWQRIVGGGGNYRAEHRIGHRDGSWVHALTQVVPETDSHGRIVGYVGTSTDLTDLKEAEHALARSEARLRLALQSAGMVSWEVDLDAGRIHWSDGAASLLGLREDDLPWDLARGWSMFSRSEVAFRSGSATESLETGEPFELEARITTAGGEPRWILARGQARPGGSEDGRRIVGVIADVSARRRIAEERAEFEQKLVEAQRLESLGLLAGGVAHDFNNLLVGILGNAELALERLASDTPTRALVEGIRNAGVRAAELVHQILAYAGHGPMLRQRVDLAALARETVDLLRASLPPNARLTVDTPEQPAIVAGDPTQLRQVVMNLLVNAGESLPKDGGDVRVRIEHVVAAPSGDAAPAAWLTLDVVDSGLGMDAQTRARIFDPFYTTRATGRGLGLAVVHGIVRGHGGTIEVESEPGLGTRMRVRLPTAPGEAEAIRPAPGGTRAVEDVASALVLVVDDERAVREVVRLSLESAGHRVLLAANVAEARGHFAVHGCTIEVILLDLTLGSETSEHVIAEIRASSTEVPVLVMSGYPEEEAIGRLAALGVSAFLQKPFTPARLNGSVSRALAELRRRKPA